MYNFKPHLGVTGNEYRRGETWRSASLRKVGRCGFKSHRRGPFTMKLSDKILNWLSGEHDYPKEPSRFWVTFTLKDGRSEKREFYSRQKADGADYPATEQLAEYFRNWKKQPVTWEDGKLARYSDFACMEVS